MLTLSLDQNSRTSTGMYVFSSQPRVVQQKAKYRQHTADAAYHLPYSNLMFDKRVIRGNAFSNSRNFESPYQGTDGGAKNSSGGKKISSNSTRVAKRSAWMRNTPEPVEGRQHMKLQTELYLEELGGVVEEADAVCQTDPFLDRPPTPLFVPAKTGMDRETQIYDGDLFDFDLEVQPILEVLVGKVTEQALIEVAEEEELASLRQRQKMFEELREAELQEQQRLEEIEQRKKEEKLRVMKQQEERKRQEEETAEKIAAKVYSQQLVADLVPSVIASLSENGFFHDPVEKEIESVFFPKLLGEVRRSLTTHMTARKVLDGLIAETVVKRAETARTSESLERPEKGMNPFSADDAPHTWRAAEAAEGSVAGHGDASANEEEEEEEEEEDEERKTPTQISKTFEDEDRESPVESDAEADD